MHFTTEHPCRVARCATFLTMTFCVAACALASGQDKKCLNVVNGIAREYGQLTSNEPEKDYCVDAHAGQMMKVTIVPQTSDLVSKGIVIFPISHQVDGGPGGVIFNDKLPEDGQYEIVVGGRNQITSGAFELIVELK